MNHLRTIPEDRPEPGLVRLAGAGSLLLVAFLVVGGAEPAQSPAGEPATDPPLSVEARPPSFLTRPVEELPPLARDLRLRLEAGDLALQEVEAAFVAAKSGPERAHLLRRVGEIKAQTEIDLMGIQLEYARREGRAEDVAQLEAGLEALAHPEVPVHPEARPAPVRK